MKHVLLLVMLVGLVVQVHGQSVQVSGTISDADGNSPLPGVSILVKGTTNGTYSDAEGKYTIEVAKESTLVFSFIGYATQEMPVGEQTSINISLSASSEMLSEVTVTALGIKRERKVLGYAVSDINNKDITGNGETNGMASIAGKLAGVAITGTTAGPTGSTRVVIRGIRELSADSQPLYVIDGVPAVNGNIGSASQWGGMDLGDGVSDINPNDIESISVLKGSAAAALYGSRALNGVILITTKSGRAAKGLSVEFNSSLTIDKISTRQDARQKTYGQGNDGVFPTDPLQSQNITSNWGPSFAEETEITQNDGIVRPYRYIDKNIENFFREGKTWMNTIAISGGNEDTNVRLSYSNITNDDIIPKSGLDKDMIALRAMSKISKKFTIDAKVNYADERVKNRPALTDELNNLGNGLLGLAANYDQAWLQRYANDDGTYINYTGNVYRANPYWTLNRTFNKSKKERVGGLVNLNYEINSMFSVNLQAGTDFFSFKHENFYDKYTPALEGGALFQIEQTTKETNFQGMLNFKKEVGSFHIGAMLGANVMKYRSYGNGINATQIIQPGTPNLVNFQSVLIAPFDAREEVHSVFGTVNLGYKEFLFLNLQGRNDWASSLPKSNWSFFYPSADVSFVLTDAFDNLQSPVLSLAKIRTSYGQVGADYVPYQTGLAYSMTGRIFQGNPMGEILGTSIPNADLKPQIKTSFEIGADVGLFNDRVGLDFTYYDETTDDVLLAITIPETSGYNSAVLNAATLRNKGVELMVRTTPVIMPNSLRWDLSFNYAKNVNEVVKLSDELGTFTVAEARWAGATIIAETGKPFGTIMGAGFRRDENGNRVFNSSNGEPLATSQPIALGNTLPDWTGGITNTLSYKGIELKAVFDFRMGGDMFSMTNMTMHMNGSHLNTEAGRESWNEYQQERRAAQLLAEQNGDVANVDDPNDAYYVPRNNRGYIGEGVNEQGEPNDRAISPAAYWQSIGNNIPEPFVYDGSYVKLRDLTLTYNLPSSLLKGTPLRGVSLSVIGRNLFILYKNTPNIDPESNYNVSNGQGFEYGSLPGRRRYGFNLVVKL